jgi:hypothetical protein
MHTSAYNTIYQTDEKEVMSIVAAIGRRCTYIMLFNHLLQLTMAA